MSFRFRACGDNPDAMCNGGKGRGLWCTVACILRRGEIELPMITYAEAQTHPSYETVKRVRTAEHELSFASDDDEMPDVIRDELNEIRRQLENFLNTRIIPYWRNSSGFNPDIRG